MSPHLLVVEDDADSRDMLAHVCEDEGHTVHAVGSVDEAIAALASEEFDAVIADGFANFGAGSSEAERLLAAAKDIPVIGHTGWPVTQQQAKERGFVAMLRKPAKLAELFAAITRACTR